MENKESPLTGLEKYSIDELREGMGVADQKGYWKGKTQGTIYSELSKRVQPEEQTERIPPISQKPARVKKVRPIKEGKINSPIDHNWAMRGIGKNRGNR